MKNIAIYGKGGIGKSTICSALSLTLAQEGYTVMQIGCDPKADSTMTLREGKPLATILETMRRRKDDFTLEDITCIGAGGVICVEAGGPIPGLGCAGRGIITALEKLKAKGAYERFQPDVVFYDVLGDVVCGGFSMPMRSGYADEVYIVTSGENMSVYAAANIAAALRGFQNRGYAALGGVILNRRNAEREEEKVRELCEDFHTQIIGTIPFSEKIQKADRVNKSVMELFPESEEAKSLQAIAHELLRNNGA